MVESGIVESGWRPGVTNGATKGWTGLVPGMPPHRRVVWTESNLRMSGQSSSNMPSTTFIARLHSRLIMGFIFSFSFPFWENHDLFIVEMSLT